MSEQFRCEHCEKPLITVAPGRFATHSAISIRASSLEGRAWIECPTCGRETRIDQAELGVRFS